MMETATRFERKDLKEPPDTCMMEETGNGTITRYIRGLGIISSDSEEAKTYYHYVSDEQGSITHVLSEDAEILNHYSYDAFGNIIEKTEKVENRFCYNGEMLDPVTQQYYLRARFYNPVIGRFTQEDTYYGDGLNLYQYCQANPVGYVDPSGHNICPTQLSLYKKYKEFFAKKMPEAEAKKKAYEYMRKKMGLTADNPFTEASEGGTKPAYNDSGVGKSKNPWKSYETSYEKSSPNLEKPKGWKVGNPIDNLTRAGNEPSWNTVKSRYWKNEAYYNAELYSQRNLKFMKKGKAPHYSESIDVPKELHHIEGRNIPNPHNETNLLEVWPWEHDDIDPYRFYIGPRP